MTPVTLFLCGDVMTGRGIDQILAHPGKPEIHEPVARTAGHYVMLAERENGPIPLPVPDAYPWGDALEVWERLSPQLRLINLETAVTSCDDPWPGKGIHYRMHPANLGVLAAARPDCCILANNHVLDWGTVGLQETLAVLAAAGMASAGAGADRAAAESPAALPLPDGGRLLVFAWASPDSGVPSDWAAGEDRAGVARLENAGAEGAASILAALGRHKGPGDLAVVSLHWGPNWGYAVPPWQREFAHRLVAGGADLVWGHSSHHPKGIEVFRERLILYGCGDFLNDYEGIGGPHRNYRPELGLMYFPAMEAGTGGLLRLLVVPTRIRRFQVVRADADETAWLAEMLDREGAPFGTRVVPDPEGLRLAWH